MNVLTAIFALLFFTALIAFIIKQIDGLLDGLITMFNWGTRYRLKHYWFRHILKKELKQEYKSVLNEYFLYYRRINPENQKIFERRLQYFIDTKEFISRSGDLPVTNEMIVLISACAIQLTFGLPGIFLSHFYRILIYPDDYYSSITKKYHQGEVNRAGVIVLSWKNFLVGFTNREDGRNLGLHEMAHALLLENRITNNEYEFLSPKHLKKWQEISDREMLKINSGQSIFRAYGATDTHEFFAVAVEVYFETPEKLRNYDRELYETLSGLLNQDILDLLN